MFLSHFINADLQECHLFTNKDKFGLLLWTFTDVVVAHFHEEYLDSHSN